MFYGTIYGPVQYSSQAYNVIVRFLNQVMAEPVDVEIDATVEKLYVRLRSSLRDVSSGILRGDQQVVSRMLGPH